MHRQKSKKARFSGSFRIAVVKQLPRNKLGLGERDIQWKHLTVIFDMALCRGCAAFVDVLYALLLVNHI